MKNTLLIIIPAILLASCVAPEEKTTDKVENTNSNIVETRIGDLAFTHDFENGYPTKESVEILYDEMDFQRACQAYIWGLGPSSLLEWQRHSTETFGATANDIVSYATYEAKQGILTANATTPYLAGFANLNETGPLVIEVPAGSTAGLVNDFWHKAVVDMGVTGPDKGQGVKYIVLGPDQEVEYAKGYSLVNSSTMNIFWGTRILDKDPEIGAALLKGFKVYPYSERANPTPTKVIPVAEGTTWLAIQARGLDYWKNLSKYINSEPVQERDRLIMAMLKPLGIEKGKEFNPTERQKKILIDAALVGEAMAKANSFNKRFEGAHYWEKGSWKELMMVHPTQRTEFYDQLDERAAYTYEASTTSMAMISKTPGLGQAYLGAYQDEEGNGLDGSKTYKLTVPAEVPAANFWSLTVYDVSTRCLINNPQRLADRSSRNDMVKNADGTIDLYVGPEAPEGLEKNWIPSVKGQGWFCYFRLYGPTEAHFNKTWNLPDFEIVE